MKKVLHPFARILASSPLFVMASVGLLLVAGGVAVKTDIAWSAILVGAVLFVAASSAALRLGRTPGGSR